MRHALLLVMAGCAAAQSQYDLLLKGGHVIDARNGLSAVRDVAVLQGIAAVEPEPGKTGEDWDHATRK